MAGDRIIYFNGANFILNDIHDNHNCTIIVPKGGSTNDTQHSTPTTETPAPTEVEDAEVVPSLWRCITKKAIEEGLEDEVYQDIQESSRKTAPVLAKRLSFRARAGHIDISQFWKTDLYDELVRVFGTLPYDKENFRKCDIYGVKQKQTAAF